MRCLVSCVKELRPGNNEEPLKGIKQECIMIILERSLLNGMENGVGRSKTRSWEANGVPAAGTRIEKAIGEEKPFRLE